MLTGVSSSYIDQLNSNLGNPQRKFLIGTSDYSDYVTKWPTLKRSVEIQDIGAINVSLANMDGTFNGFYLNTYSVPNTVTFQLGFDSEYATVFYGFIKKVDYSGDNCNITVKDRLYDFTQKRVASTNSAAIYSATIPSNIAWDLCTCYGGLSPFRDCASYTFAGSDYGWTSSHGTLTSSTTSIRLTPANSYASFNSHNLVYQGSLYPTIKMNIQRAGGSGWFGKLYYSTASHGFTDSYYIAINTPAINTSYHTLTCDLSSLTLGGDDYSVNTIGLLCFRFGASSADVFNIQGVSICSSLTNPDICFSSWAEWSSVFSADWLKTSARFADHKVVNALTELCSITDSGIWVGRDGKLHFKRFTAADSNSILIQESDIKDFDIDIDNTRVVNKAFVDFEWSQTSNYFVRTVSAINSGSVAAFGLKEETYQSQVVWWVSSVDAQNLANRQITKYKDLPAYIDLTVGLKGFNMDLGESVRLSNSFYNINSGTAWTIYNEEANLNTGFIKQNLRPIISSTAFYLDVSCLDGTDKLL